MNNEKKISMVGIYRFVTVTLLHPELKVLVVLEGAPGASPGETMLEKEPVAEVAGFYFISERARAVGIGLALHAEPHGVGDLHRDEVLGGGCQIRQKNIRTE